MALNTLEMDLKTLGAVEETRAVGLKTLETGLKRVKMLLEDA